MTNRRLKILWRIAYWGLPLAILWAVLSRIDVQQFLEGVRHTRPFWVVLGIAYYPLVIVLGALRWRVLLAHRMVDRVPIGFAIKHYWIGLSLGLFVPASLGWDAYRVVAAGRRFGRYGVNAAVIAAEKLLALAACTAMVLVLYPLVPVQHSAGFHRITGTAAILLSVALGVFVFLNVALRNRLVGGLVQRGETAFTQWLARVLERRGAGRPPDLGGLSFRAVVEPMTGLRQLLPALGITLGIQVVAAVGNQLLFRAVGYDVPFVANLFVIPILFFVFLLPISFGSLGVREGAYVVLYGLFGVPPETALLVSMLNLCGLMLNYVIGALLVFVSGARAAELNRGP